MEEKKIEEEIKEEIKEEHQEMLKQLVIARLKQIPDNLRLSIG